MHSMCGAGERLARVLDPSCSSARLADDDRAGRGGRDDRQHEDGRQRHRDREPAAPATAGQGGRRRCPRARAPRARRVGSWRSVVVVHRGHLRSSAACSVRPFDLYNTAARRIGITGTAARRIVSRGGRRERPSHTARGAMVSAARWQRVQESRSAGGGRWRSGARRTTGRPVDAGRRRPARRAPYFEIRPDPADPAQRVAFGTSGHRGSSLNGAFNEAHIAATTEAICRYRESQGIDGPLFIGTRHARPVRAGVPDGARGPRRARRRRPVDAADGYTPTPAISHAILVHNRGRRDHLADGIVVTPSHNPPEDGGFKYNPPNGGPADTDVTSWIQDEANRLLEADLDGVRRIAARATRAPRRPPHDYVDDLRRGSRHGHRHGRDPRVRAAARRRPARRRERRLLAGASRERYGLDLTVTNDVGRPAVRVHDLRLGRPDPDGPVVAVRDGPAGRAARPVRRRLRQRHRRRPPRHRHAAAPACSTRTTSCRPRSRYLFGGGRDWGADVAVGKTLVSSAMIDRVDRRPRPAPARGPGRVQVVRGRAGRRQPRVRWRGERRRLVPAPRRHGLDDRQGRDHRLPAGGRDDRADRPRPGRGVRAS